HQRWNALILRVADHGDQLLNAVAALWRDNAELGKMRAQRVDDRGHLANVEVARAMQDEHRLLLWSLDRYEPHARPQHRLANGLGICCIVLLPLHERLHIGWWHQLDGVAKRGQFARPVVRRGARLDADRARRELREERDHAGTLQ